MLSSLLLGSAAQVEVVAATTERLLQYGAIGIFAVCLLAAVIVLARAMQEQIRGRLADREAQQQKYERMLQETTRALTEVRRTLEDIVEATAEGEPAPPAPKPEPRGRKTTER